mmetsp:Transcript_4360/g.16449  ORF Transcript_4360/g.16449 Transcript_4360/m.16449 type:complete len:210 (-) Transcript_4360:187-816(-)
MRWERAAAKEKAERNAEEQAEKDKDEEKNNSTKHQADALHREEEEIFTRVAAEEQAASEHDHQVELNKARARVGAIEKQLAADDVARKTAEAQAKEDDDNGKAALRRSIEDISKHLGEMDDELKAMKEIEERMAAEKARLVAIQDASSTTSTTRTTTWKSTSTRTTTFTRTTTSTRTEATTSTRKTTNRKATTHQDLFRRLEIGEVVTQ